MHSFKQFSLANVFHTAELSRWHAVATNRRQYLSEHLYKVTMVAIYLLAYINPKATRDEMLQLILLCLTHDLPETVTGDLPTPIKRLIESMFGRDDNPLDKLELSLCAPYKEIREEVEGVYLERIAKLADVLDALHFIRAEGKGRERKQIAKERKKAYLDYVASAQVKWPEHNWAGALDVLDRLFTDELYKISFNEILSETAGGSSATVPTFVVRTCPSTSASIWTRLSFMLRKPLSRAGR